MKILHLFPVSLYSDAYLEFINKNYNCNEHEFIMMDIGGRLQTNKKYCDIFKMSDVSTFSLKDVFVLRKRLKKNDYDKLVVHSLYLNYLVLALYFNKKVLRKSTITLWGGSDCGKFKVAGENKKYFIQAMLYNIVRKQIFKNTASIGATLNSDYEKVVNAYSTLSPKVECKYLIPTSIEYLNYNLKQSSEVFKIQVGHSGSKNGNQIEVLNKLVKFKEENIEIYCPLAYGDDFHIQEVVEFGEKNFGSKFIAMKKLMPSEEFASFISNMDMIIINTEIQQALGNIYSYLYAGKKVFLRNNSTLWKYFNELGFKIESISELDKIDFKKIVHRDQKMLEYNHEKSMIQFDEEKIKLYWDDVFYA